MGSLWWWCALLTTASAQRLDVWSPQNNSETSERDVTLGFTGILPEGDRAEAYRVCVALDGEPMTCNALDVMAREQLVLFGLPQQLARDTEQREELTWIRQNREELAQMYTCDGLVYVMA